MLRIGIIADDLTGASDTAVQFVRAGWNTELQLDLFPSSASAIAVTTDSRHADPRSAADAVSSVVSRFRRAGVTHLYKKIDSTLRGQIRAETHAVREAWSPTSLAVVCPAYPAHGRLLTGGMLLVRGTPVAQTAAGSDPVSPVTESQVPTLIGGSHVTRRLGESTAELAERIRGCGPVVVVDASSEAEIRQLAGAVALLGTEAIAVGSAGLARHLAFAWAIDRLAPPVVVIVTSMNEAARRQADVLVESGALHFEPGIEELDDDAQWRQWMTTVLQQLDRVISAVVLTAPSEQRTPFPAVLIPQRLAELASLILKRGRTSGVVVTGGDAARALVEVLGARAIELRDEVVPGMPLGKLIDGAADGLPIVTKAGGFGDEDALLQAVDCLRFRRHA
jgi:uncharacterized protein YgbK (DUF1537 family)